MTVKTEMTTTAQQPMMGSRQIASVTGKQHKHVARDILAMLEQLGLYSPNMDFIDFKGFIIKNKEHNGRTVIDEIFLNESLSMTLVTGYDACRRLALVEQWQDMKQELSRHALQFNHRSRHPQQITIFFRWPAWLLKQQHQRR